MTLFGRLGHDALSDWKLGRRGGDRAIVEHVVARLRGRLGIEQLERLSRELDREAASRGQ